MDVIRHQFLFIDQKPVEGQCMTALVCLNCAVTIVGPVIFSYPVIANKSSGHIGLTTGHLSLKVPYSGDSQAESTDNSRSLFRCPLATSSFDTPGLAS